MLPALGLLLLLPLAGAFRQDESFSLFSNFSHEAGDGPLRGFTVTSLSKDGEVRRITRWDGICAKETIVDWGDTDVALREVWLEGSGRKLQLIYEGDTLSDCVDGGHGKGGGKVAGEEAACLSGVHSDDYDDGARIEVFEEEEEAAPTTPPELSWLLPVAGLRYRCDRARSRARNQVMTAQYRHRRPKRGLQDMVIAPGTKWCGPHQVASAYKELGALDSLDRCCRRHDHCRRSIPPLTQRYNVFNFWPFTLSHCGCDQRDLPSTGTASGSRKRRRSRVRGRRELLLMPGTQWCGRGNRATKYTNLGRFGKADACCRRHDTACPFHIPAFQTRYGLFNWRISTIMHCACDERFRTCLKMAGTSSANLIGKIFFNVVQTKCFVLKPQKVCAKRSWWGKCEHYEYRKQAHLRDNVSY